MCLPHVSLGEIWIQHQGALLDSPEQPQELFTVQHLIIELLECLNSRQPQPRLRVFRVRSNSLQVELMGALDITLGPPL